ncbi:MAG: nicotinamide mononucleotide transporter, partial [Selenomonadaceae bacterium]|nr:nicotinamide mononucleotide transporter [Selenomonadaceae bacterium]
MICFQEQLWGKLVENAFYFITMLVGLIIWSRNKREEKVV